MTKFNTFIIGLLFCMALSPLMGQGVPSRVPWKTTEYTLMAREMPLRDALMSFGTSQGLAVIMSKDVTGFVSGDFKQLPPGQFLDQLTALYNLSWYYDGSAIYVCTGSETVTMLLDLKYMKAADVQAMLKELGVEDERYPLKTTSDSELVMVAGPPRYVQLVVELVEKADILQEKRAYSEVETRVFMLRNTWADDVTLSSSGSESSGAIKGVASLLKDIMQSNDTGRVLDHGIQNGETDGGAGQEELSDLLKSQSDRAVKPIITAENRLNAVIVRDVVSRMPLYERLIKELDVPQKLIEIAVTSVELSKDDALDWQLSIAALGQRDHVQGGAGQNAASLFSPTDLLGGGLSGALAYVGKHAQISASLTALRDKGKARSISRSSLLTMNNMSASMIDEQSYHARVIGTEVASLEEVSAGMRLDVKPRLVEAKNPDEPNQLWMTVSLEDGGFESVTIDSMPLTRNSSIKTQTAVFEGESIILAGYFRDIDEKAGWGIPLLRDIPFIGWLFGGISHKKETVQRVFILTPYVVDLDVEALARSQASRQRDVLEVEELEDDKDADDEAVERRRLIRKNENDKRRQRHKDELKLIRKEIDLDRDQWDVEHKEEVRMMMEDLRIRRILWEESLENAVADVSWEEAMDANSADASAEEALDSAAADASAEEEVVESAKDSSNE